MPKSAPAVLYVEDEENDAFLMRMAFAREGSQAMLQTVSTGQAALDYLAGTGPYVDRSKYPFPDVVLLDLNLPEVHGFDVLRWIRAHPLHGALPVVIFSSSQKEEDRATARLLGANDFLTKPNSLNLFRGVVRELSSRWLNSESAGIEPA